MKYVKLTIKTLERCQWRRFVVYIVNFELILYLLLAFLMWLLSMYLFALSELYYISVIFRFDGFRFHPFLKRISMEWNEQGADLKQQNGKYISIKFLWWKWNYEVTILIINGLHTFFYKQHLFQLSLNVAGLFHELNFFKCYLDDAQYI